MLSNDTIINVTNRDSGSVGYEISDLGIQRRYEPGETKQVTYEEIVKLSYIPGGMPLLEDYLVMDNKEAIAAILGEVEPEYFYTAEDVKNLLLNGSLEQLEDCLDFADNGVIDLVKKMAVDLEINDVSKRKAIYNKTGFSVDSAIAINEMDKEDEPEEAAPQTKRRAAPIQHEEAAKPVRRTAAPNKYKVVSK